MGGKYRYLLKNIGLMTISNFSSKILSFLLVPLYTSALSTEEYGTYDLYTTTAFLLIPLLSVCVSDATLRYTLDRQKEPGAVLSISMKFYVRACLCVTMLIALNAIIDVVPLFNQYPLFFLIYYFLCLLSDILTQFARGLEKITDVAISGILSSIATIALNILLLLIFPLGLEGYFIANCSAFAVTITFLVVRLEIWKYVKISTSKQLEKEMEKYSAPLIFNQIGWWINNVSDRYVVTWLCGTAANGIYSVAYKIPSLLTMFQTIFNQAWTLSAVKELDEGGSSLYSTTYTYYNCGMVILCSLLIAGDKIIAHILFANEFYMAWQYAPFLMMSVVFGSLSGLLGGVFTAVKNSKVIARTTVVGASVNTILNFILVMFMGPVGAAIATLISYVLVWATRLNAAKKVVKIEIRLIRDIISYLVLILQCFVLYFNNSIFLYAFELFAFVLIMIIYFDDIKKVTVYLKGKMHN